MYAARGEQSAALFAARKSLAAEGSKPLSERVAEAGTSSAGRSRVGGNRELSFTPKYAPRYYSPASPKILPQFLPFTAA